MREARAFLNARRGEAILLQRGAGRSPERAPRLAFALHRCPGMSHTELHRLERAQAHGAALPAARIAATLTEGALLVLVVGIWWVTCAAG
jgi:hypothetical protein